MPGQTKYYNVEASTIKRDITTMTIITVNVIQFAEMQDAFFLGQGKSHIQLKL